MSWRNKQVDLTGAVHFRGTMPPRAENFAFMQKQGFKFKRMEPNASAHWGLHCRHEKYGSVWMTAVRNAPPLPPSFIEWDPRLTPLEKQEALQAGAAVFFQMEGTRGDVLRDRKNFLHFLGAAMGDDGVAVHDLAAQRFWSRAALDEELAHDAELDVDGLYTMHHVVESEADGAPSWLHTHGLAEIGFFDFDVLSPSEDLTERGMDFLRVLAFAIVEGNAKCNEPKVKIAEPGGIVRLVDVATFNAKAEPDVKALRLGSDESDEDHNANRSIVCELQGGLLSGLFGGSKIRSSKFCSSPLDDNLLFMFSNEATAMMAERARKTVNLFAALKEELAEFEFPTLAKLGYPIDNAAGEFEKEHLWFECHQISGDKIEGTLANDPIGIARMKAGQRGWHDAGLLSDWTIMTPLGMVTPRDTRPARIIRSNRDEFRRILQEAQ